MKFPILLPNVFNHPFTYESELDLKVGDYVDVPFGKSIITGVVWNEFEQDTNKKFTIKKILKKNNVPPLKKNIIKFLNWFSDYNMVPKGMALKLLLLGSKVVEKLSKQHYQQFFQIIQNKKFKLSEDQKESLSKMNKYNKKFRVHVLQGTTGSGKTIVYFEAIKEVIKNDLQSLILLPEIGLTSQFEEKFEEFFGFKPAIWHSGVTKKKKKLFGVVLLMEKLK